MALKVILCNDKHVTISMAFNAIIDNNSVTIDDSHVMIGNVHESISM